MAQIPDIDVTTISVGGSAYTVPFAYQNRAEVFVEVDGVSTTFTWINDGNISITPAPAAGAVVRRYRSTSALKIRHDYRNGVPFTPRNIAENNDQLLFVVQESVNDTASTAALALATSEQALDTAQDALDFVGERTQYMVLGPYGPGLEFQTTSQVFSYGGEFYAPGPSITLPYTTTGVGAAEIANFRSVGDAVLRQDLASGVDPAKGSALVGYRGRTVHQRLDDEINVKDYGAKGDNATDDYAAFAAAIAAAEAAGGGDVIVPGGTFLLSQTVTLPPYVALRGEGANRTILKSTSITGSVLHVTGSFCGVFDMTIGASDARKAGGSLGGFGIRQEAVDLPGRDTTCCTYQRLIVKDQPRHGIVLVASTMTALITQCIVRDNGGHGVWINNGEAVGRTNITRPGGIRIIDCKIQDNVGHSVKAGEGGSAIHGTAYRIFIDNCDTFRNATTDAIRSYNAGMHLFGEDIEVRNSALCGFAGIGGITPTTGGIWVGGRNIKLINNRYVNVVGEAVYVGNSVDLSTQDVDIDGILVTGNEYAVSLDPAVRVQSGAVGVRAVTHSTALITNLMTPTAVQYYSEFGNRIRSDIQRRQRQFSPSGVSSAIQNLSIADDQAAYINFSAPAQGVLVISGSIAARGGAMVFFRVGATGHCTLMSSGGATVSVGTGALSTGAGDGVDGNLNIYADTATNRLYIKNRTGAAGNYGYTLLNVTQDVEADDLVRL